MKWFHIYIDGSFYKTVKGRTAESVLRKYQHLAKTQINVTDHNTGEETMLGKASR